MSKRDLPLKKALMWILLATCLVSGSASLGILYYFHLKEMQKQDPAYRVIAIVQTGPYQGYFRTVYLAELLGLSIDRPTNLYALNLKKETQKLLASPLIKSAKMTKVKPGTVSIDYTPRIPVAHLGDFTNTAIDAEGYLIPFKPFFSPKKLPEIFVGDNGREVKWGHPLKGGLALKVFSSLTTLCRKERFSLRKLDISRAEKASLGQKQFVAEMDDGNSVWILRLSVDNYETDFTRFIALYHELQKKGLIGGMETTTVDLRIPQLAYIKQDRKFLDQNY